MTRFAQNPLKGLALALRALHFHGVVRLRDNLLEEIAALKASKLEDGHKRSSKNTRLRYTDAKL
jgi:hypothetical protein